MRNIVRTLVPALMAAVTFSSGIGAGSVPVSNVIDDILNQWSEERTAEYVSDEYVRDLSSDSIIDVSGQGVWPNTACNFTKEMTSGSTYVTRNKTSSFPYEGRYGIDAYAENETIYIKAYSNLGYDPVIKSVTITGHGKDNVITKQIEYKDHTAVDVSDRSGAYKVKTVFMVDGHEVTNELAFFVDNNEVWLCELATLSADDLAKRREHFCEIMEDLDFTPENQLSLDEITYPVPGDDSHRCDTMRWADFSSELVADPSWSDGYKVMIFHDWICGNISYDNYKTDVLHKSRAAYYGDYSGTYSTWDTKAGVCADVSHIFLIMCRYNGIPCMTVESETYNHQWNAVYINNRWYEIDLTTDLYRHVRTEDINSISYSGTASYTAVDYGTPLESINNQLWTYECAYGSGVNYGWYFG